MLSYMRICKKRCISLSHRITKLTESYKLGMLKKTIYALKQSLRDWFDKFSAIVAQYMLKSVTYRSTVVGARLLALLIVYVDDIVVNGDDHDGITRLKSHLSSHFHKKDLVCCDTFLR